MFRNPLPACLGALTILLFAAASPAFADARSYCDAYAREAAARKSGAGDVAAGAIGGALAGAFIGALIDDGEGAGKGAIIGGGAGTVLGIGLSQEARKRAYEKAHAACMNQYSPAPQRVATSNNRDAHCAGKYRSYDARTRLYKAKSGKWRPCR